MCSIKKLASLWRSDLHAKTVFEEEVVDTADGEYFMLKQYMMCGVWWMWGIRSGLYIRDCNANVKLSRTWPTASFSAHWQGNILSVTVDPLQDLVIIVSSEVSCMVIDAGQDHQVFVVEFRLASSPHLPYPDAACALLECKHTFNGPGRYNIDVDKPAICGDRVVILYCVLNDMFIQVIDWRKGHIKSYPLGLRAHRNERASRLVDKQMIVVISDGGLLTLYTLRALDGSPQRRITYLLPKLYSYPFYTIHSTPLFHSTEARPDLIPEYIPSLESQIMVLEILSASYPFILVIDMAIFTAPAIHSETPVTIPWSDWGTRYTSCFPHHEHHKISVFGSKMAYVLPVDYVPEPGQRLQGFCNDPDLFELGVFPTEEEYFYVHIWDFNQRAIAHAESACYRNSQRPHICRPGDIDQSDLLEDTLSDRPYIATVCHTPFEIDGFYISDLDLFLEQDRFTLTCSHHLLSPLSIQVVCPVQTEAGSDLMD